jgi:hypothetical protein
MADSELKLPGNFQAGKKYLIDGGILKAWQTALKADRVIAGPGLNEQGSPQGRIFKAQGGGKSPSAHPFQLSVSAGAGGPKYQVSKGSITDGTNGVAVALGDIFSSDESASAGYVVLEASVSEDMTTSGWELKIIATAGGTKEVGLTTGDPVRQEKIRLLIGKITLDGTTPTAWQALFTSVVIGTRLLNGVEIKAFDAAPTLAAEI